MLDRVANEAAETMLRNSLIIAAHPDDELLWFGAILDKVDRVLLVYEDFWPKPEVGRARAAVLENYPLENISSLRIPEAGTHSCADWQNPQLSAFGIELGMEARKRDLKQKVKRAIGKSNAPPHGIARRYEENFDRLCEGLRPLLAQDMNVFTHNPWGEYGHEDHIQVFRAVEKLQREIGFTQWMSNYCTERSLPLAMRYFDNDADDFVQLPVDPAFADSVADVYRQHDCWTWAEDWKWFPFELYRKAPGGTRDQDGQPHLFPLNMFRLGT